MSRLSRNEIISVCALCITIMLYVELPLMGTVVLYPDPGSLEGFQNLWKSKRYAVRVNGEPVTVYAMRNRECSDITGKKIPQGYITEAHFCYFSFSDEPVTVEVTSPEGIPLSHGSVHPTRLKLPCVAEDTRITIQLTEPRKIVVTTCADEPIPLVILSDLPDRDIPSGTNVTRYGPGIHNIGLQRKIRDNEIIYIDGGAVVKGTFFKPKQEGPLRHFTLRGRGIVYSGDDEFRPQIRGWGRGITGWEAGMENGIIEGCILADSLHWNTGFRNANSSFSNLKIISFYGNTDGIRVGPNSVCRDSFVMNNDDSLLPEGSFPPGTSALIENCVVWHHAWGSPFKIINQTKGGSDGVHDITYRNIDILEAGIPGSAAVFLSPRTVSGDNPQNGPTYNILFENIYIERASKLFDLRPPVRNIFSNIVFRNIYAPTAAGRIEGWDDEHCIRNITFDNIVIDGTPVTGRDEKRLPIGNNVHNITIRAPE